MSPAAPHDEQVATGCTLSVVSHAQGAMVGELLLDLCRLRPPALAAVVVTRNLPDDPIALPPGPPFALELVENASPRGFAENHNAALERCRTPWFVVANPDIRLPADPLPAMLAAASTDTGLVAPLVIEADGRVADSARPLVTPYELVSRHVGGRREFAGPRAAWFAGMFLLLRAEALRAIGGFDARYRLYCEDVDLCARLRLAGWRLVLCDGARVVHHARRASRRSPAYTARHLASLCRLWTSAPFWRYRRLLAAERARA